MITIPQDDLIDAAYDAGLSEEDVRTDYSGRFMFGNRCVGVVVDSAGDLLKFVAALMERGVDMDDLDNVREDSMGRSIIYYWPNIGVRDAD